MFALILIVLLGLGIALFSQQNSQTVGVVVGNYFFPAVPVYLVAIVSLLFGLFVSWILSVMDFFSHSLLLRRKENALHHADKRLSEMEHQIHTLEIENARLRSETGESVQAEDRDEHQSFSEQLRERFAHYNRKEALS